MHRFEMNNNTKDQNVFSHCKLKSKTNLDPKINVCVHISKYVKHT